MSETIDTTVPEYLGRMIKEKAELEQRIKDLRSFIKENPKFGELSQIDRALMVEQEISMSAYLTTLAARLHRAVSPRQEPPQR
jgi:hypothetical protein